MRIGNDTMKRLAMKLIEAHSTLRAKDYDLALKSLNDATAIILDAFIEGEMSAAHQPEVRASSFWSSGSYTGGGCTWGVMPLAA